MKIICVNAGSSSLKFSLFNMEKEEVIASGLFERIGMNNSNSVIKYNGQRIEHEVEMKDHTDAVNVLFDKLISLNIIESLSEIDGVGHRLVHGKDKYSDSVVITDEVVKDLLEFKEFAPLHNPANVLGINAFREKLPNVVMVGVFDTAFHQTIEEENYLYATSYDWYKDYGVRKYGFHGTSHRYITETLTNKLGKKDFKLINCHIGNGASLAAINNGKCINTTMGFTPLSGVIMGTRSGDIDPSIIPYVMEKEGMNANEVIDELNKTSGLLGISGKSGDMRDILAGMDERDSRCYLAFNKYCRSVTNYIASYYVELGGVDVISFTAGVGENSAPFRKMVCDNLACLGVKIDYDKNDTILGEFAKISTDDSKIEVYVVPTDEELLVARDTLKFIEN